MEVPMLGNTRAFSSFSVDDLEAAKAFYGQTLGLAVSENAGMGILSLRLAGGHEILVYAKQGHQPASYTALNFTVEDIARAVEQLTARGVALQRYEGFEQDEKGIARPSSPEHGPPIAWFTDPAGNILAVLEE
jgi:predicted enzyme related to lactoylglutathione lyase